MLGPPSVELAPFFLPAGWAGSPVRMSRRMEFVREPLDARPRGDDLTCHHHPVRARSPRPRILVELRAWTSETLDHPEHGIMAAAASLFKIRRILPSTTVSCFCLFPALFPYFQPCIAARRRPRGCIPGASCGIDRTHDEDRDRSSLAGGLGMAGPVPGRW